MSHHIEVELRSFIDKDEYNRLQQLLDSQATRVSDEHEQNIHFRGSHDLRMQYGNHPKVWLKKGVMHDNARKEIELHLEHDQIKTLHTILSELGYKEESVWIRHRKKYTWEGTTICLDYTKGYSHIVELERCCTPEEQEQELQILQQQCEKLGITPTPQHEQQQRLEHYKQHWKTLLKNDTPHQNQ